MKNTLWALLLIGGFIAGCKKDSFITGRDASLRVSSDTLFFDTVFTTTGSVTQSLKIINGNNQQLKISDITLAGGTASYFSINVDGSPGPQHSGLVLEANDSLYIFVAVTIKPGSVNLPFVIRDSIGVSFNGNQRYIQLQAWGQNAHFLRNEVISVNTTWDNTLPYVILGGLQVAENTTLTMMPGCRVYFHADAPMLVDGTLKAVGEKYDSTRISLLGDRLDAPYRDYPGSWPGIYFHETSVSNQLEYVNVKNAYQAIVAQNYASNGQPKLVMDQCIIDNSYDAGILAAQTSIRATNCLVSNCGKDIVIGYGGDYAFTHCTVAGYSNDLISHTQPVLYVSNYIVQNGVVAAGDLTAKFINCIFWGASGNVDNEVQVSKQGNTTFDVNFSHSIWKVKTAPSNVTTDQMIAATDPQFDSVDNFRRIYNFRLKASSPAVNTGANTATTIDLDGKTRPVGLPDLGCYESLF